MIPRADRIRRAFYSTGENRRRVIAADGRPCPRRCHVPESGKRRNSVLGTRRLSDPVFSIIAADTKHPVVEPGIHPLDEKESRAGAI